MTVPLRAVLAAVAGSLLLVACGGGDAEGGASPDERMAAAKTALDETSGVHIVLTGDDLPPGVNGLLGADGIGTHAPAFEGDIKVASSGLSVDAAVIAVDGEVFAILPFTTEYTPIDPADYQAPDPAALMATDGGLSSLLTSVEGLEAGEQVRDGDRVLSEFEGTLSGEEVAAVIPSAQADADFEATFTLDDEDRLSRVVITGPFYPAADDVTYTIEFDEYGTEQDIKAP